jgi:hypothetical protein
MSLNQDNKSNLWVPERAYGVCVYFTEEHEALSDGDGVLCAEGVMYDLNIENRVLQAGKYWTGEDLGYVKWVAGGRKVSASEREDQAERLSDGLVADPFEDMYDEHFSARSRNGK